jgi:copper chaperone CopZ
MKRIALIFSLLFVATIGAAETFTFKVAGIDCAGCAPPIAKALGSVPGVSNVRVDWKGGTATVDLAPNADKAKLRDAISNAGFVAIFPGEQPKEIEHLPADELKKLDIVTYDGAKRVDVDKALAGGKVTVVDFYGDWCGPCAVLEARMQHLMQGKSKLAMRRINIGKWNNAAAKQATREFHASALPYIRVYDANGKFVEAVTGGMWDEVLAAIEKAER